MLTKTVPISGYTGTQVPIVFGQYLPQILNTKDLEKCIGTPGECPGIVEG